MEMSCNASVLFYGPSKVGKTTLVASGPPPVLLLDAEGGSRFLRRRKVVWSNPLMEPPDMSEHDVCVVFVRDFATLDNVYTWLHSGKHPFRTVAIDSISEAQQRCVDAIAGINQMTQPDWGNLLRRISSLVRGYRDLLIHPLNPLDCVAFTAMERVNQEGIHAPYLQGAIASVLSYYLDIVCYYGVSSDEEGQPVRKLLTKPHPQFVAGDRPGMLPSVIENPTLQAIIELSCSYDGEQMDVPPAEFPDLTAHAVDDVNPAGAGGDTNSNITEETMN
jgi:hypothetical protein